MHILHVDAAEQGMKLIAFLSRRLEGSVPAGELHRWIRTGQIRVNGGRAKAFDRLQAADAVRLPPFAAPMAKGEGRAAPQVAQGTVIGSGVTVLAVFNDLLALEKPANLPTQPGTGHETSVSGILRDFFAGAAYISAPAHRLDKATSGILLAGRTHEAQEALHALFAAPRGEASIIKTYLAWVSGVWPHAQEQVLTDSLHKAADEGTGRERMRVLSDTENADAKEARSRATLLETRETGLGAASLLKIVLETGRTHQIRVQLASRRFPVIGDAKYGGAAFPRMLLHAQSLSFPWRGEQVTVLSPPQWPAPFAALG